MDYTNYHIPIEPGRLRWSTNQCPTCLPDVILSMSLGVKILVSGTETNDTETIDVCW